MVRYMLFLLVCDFVQMFPVRGSPLFKNNTIQFNAIIRAVFLNISHRFEDDNLYGEIMRRFRIGQVTKEDIDISNSRYYKNSNVLLPPVSKIRCACYMNDEGNDENDPNLADYHTKHHPKIHHRGVCTLYIKDKK